MPEGVEVRVIADSLARDLIGLTITDVEWDTRSRYDREDLPGYDAVEHRFPGLIENIWVKGKRIIFTLVSQVDKKKFYLFSFLGMEGKWCHERQKHSNLWLNIGKKFDTTPPLFIVERVLYYDDTRHMGRVEFLANDEILKEKLDQIGPDILAYALYQKGNLPSLPESEHVTSEKWREKFRNPRLKNKQVCDFLLDQKRFGGIGNYIRNEALYIARVRPDRSLGSLSDDEIEKLRLAVIDIVYRSYMAQGLTIRSYWDPDRNKGSFKCLVYGQEKCPQGYPVIKSTFKDGRTSHWVKEIQV